VVCFFVAGNGGKENANQVMELPNGDSLVLERPIGFGRRMFNSCFPDQKNKASIPRLSITHAGCKSLLPSQEEIKTCQKGETHGDDQLEFVL
jgi:hypothetical protein